MNALVREQSCPWCHGFYETGHRAGCRYGLDPSLPPDSTSEGERSVMETSHAFGPWCQMNGCARRATHEAGWQRDAQEGVYCEYHAKMGDWSRPIAVA